MHAPEQDLINQSVFHRAASISVIPKKKQAINLEAKMMRAYIYSRHGACTSI